MVASSTGSPMPSSKPISISCTTTWVHHGLGREEVRHQIEARAPRVAEDRREAEDRDGEVLVGAEEELAFAVDLAARVEGDWIDRARLVHLDGVDPVHRAARGEDEPPHAEGSRGLLDL